MINKECLAAVIIIVIIVVILVAVYFLVLKKELGVKGRSNGSCGCGIPGDGSNCASECPTHDSRMSCAAAYTTRNSPGRSGNCQWR